MNQQVFYQNHRPAIRHGFTLVELLLTIGIISILIGLFLPALAGVRSSARGTACMVEMRQLSTRISIYADEYKGYVPFIYEYDKLNGSYITPGGIPVPEGYFETAADYWVYPMIGEFGYSYLNDALLCPNDTVSERFALWASEELDRPINQIIFMLDRTISRAFYFTPAALHEDTVPNARTMNRVAKLSDVTFPSSKAFLVEQSPFHDNFFVGEELNVYTIPGYPSKHMIAAADLSVALRSNADAVPAVLLEIQVPDAYPGNPEDYINLQRHMAAYYYTRDGVLGRDW